MPSPSEQSSGRVCEACIADPNREYHDHDRHRTPNDPLDPPRHDLPPEVWVAARLIHPFVWNGKFERGNGPMVYAGGPYWRNALLKKADELEQAAKAARVCAQYLPGEDSR